MKLRSAETIVLGLVDSVEQRPRLRGRQVLSDFPDHHAAKALIYRLIHLLLITY